MPSERLATVAARARPVALARERTLPVLPALEGLLPGGLPRGGMVATPTTSLALAVLAGPSAAGSWTGVVGLPSLGLLAAAEYGVALERLVLVAMPPANLWATVVAALVDAFDVVVVSGSSRLRAQDTRRLTARARERGAALLVVGAWPETPDVRLEMVDAEWHGLGEGHGHLQARRITVVATSRRGDDRPRTAELWLPAADGGVELAEPMADVRPLTPPAPAPALEPPKRATVARFGRQATAGARRVGAGRGRVGAGRGRVGDAGRRVGDGEQRVGDGEHLNGPKPKRPA